MLAELHKSILVISGDLIRYKSTQLYYYSALHYENISGDFLSVWLKIELLYYLEYLNKGGAGNQLAPVRHPIVWPSPQLQPIRRPREGPPTVGYPGVSPGLRSLTSSPGWSEPHGEWASKSSCHNPALGRLTLPSLPNAPRAGGTRGLRQLLGFCRPTPTHWGSLGKSVVRQLHSEHWTGNWVGQGSSQTGFSGEPRRLLGEVQGSLGDSGISGSFLKMGQDHK